MQRVAWLLKNRVMWQCLPLNQANLCEPHIDRLKLVFKEMQQAGLYHSGLVHWSCVEMFGTIQTARRIHETVNMEVKYVLTYEKENHSNVK